MAYTIKNLDRNNNGLIEGIEYVFNEKGMISWKDMVSPEFLYVNPDIKRRKKIEEKYNKQYSEIHPIDDKVEDQDLIIMLGGLKELLKIRGYKNVKYNVVHASLDYAAVSCVIDFIGNYETEGKDISFSENACAHQGNTTNFAQNYLLEIATNRALARCIRNFLNINIVSKEELGAMIAPQEEDSKIIAPNPHVVLNKLVTDRSLSVSDLKKLIDKPNESWNSIEDIPKSQAFAIIVKLKQSIK